MPAPAGLQLLCQRRGQLQLHRPSRLGRQPSPRTTRAAIFRGPLFSRTKALSPTQSRSGSRSPQKGEVTEKIEYAAVVKVAPAFVSMRRLFEESPEKIFLVAIKEFAAQWQLITDKAELDKLSECTRWRNQGASHNSDYMRFVLQSRAVHFLDRAIIHFSTARSP